MKMAQREDLRKEFLKIRREFNEKVKSKKINFFSKENLNVSESGMVVVKFQTGRLDWLNIYVDKEKEKIIEMFTNSKNSNQIEKSIIEMLKNNFKSKIIFNWETRNEIVIEYDGKETFEKYSKYTFELTQLLKSVGINE
jgi:uncharacterized protein YlbG (UPF0298 family)